MPLEKGFRAGGTIRPSRFVKITGDSTVEECDAGDPIFGISGEWTRDTPVDVYTSTGINAALDGDQVTIYGTGDAGCLLEIAGVVTAGSLLQSDANGAGIVLTTIPATADQEAGAVALEAGAAGDKIRVQVLARRQVDT